MSVADRTLGDIFTVMRDRNLSDGAKALWVLYRSYEGAWPSDERLAAIFTLVRDPGLTVSAKVRWILGYLMKNGAGRR